MLIGKKIRDCNYIWLYFKMIADWLVAIIYSKYSYFIMAAFTITSHGHSTFATGMFIIMMTNQGNGTVYPFTHTIMHFYHQSAGNSNIYK